MMEKTGLGSDSTVGKLLSVRAATSTDIPVLAQVLAQAFRHDPAHRWIFPAEAAWAHHSPRRFAGLLKQALRYGTVTTTERLQGAALWLAPPSPPSSYWHSWMATLRTLRQVRGRAPLVLQGLSALEQTHPPEPHWTLTILGTAPAQQGQGIGTALLQPVLRRCDAEQVLAYLVSSTPANIPFYERHGFVITGEFPLPHGPTLWPMRREPRIAENPVQRQCWITPARK